MSEVVVALPDIEVPSPPSWQEGDDEIINGVVTLGEMRQAVYYKEIVPVLAKYGNDMRESAEKAIKVIEEKDFIIEGLSNEIKREKKGKKAWQIVAGFLGGIALSSIIMNMTE